MFLTTDEWIERVKTDMEELTPDWDAVMTRTGGGDIEQYIRAKWEEALKLQLLKAPEHLCGGKDISASLIPLPRQDGSGRVVLPDDMLRMIRFQMKGWRRPVIKFFDRQHPRTALQYNPYSRGGAEKPAAVITTDNEGHTVLDYYALPPYMRRHEVKSAVYVPLPKEQNGGYDIAPLLGDSVCYLCAASVYDILGQNDKAALMRDHVLFS